MSFKSVFKSSKFLLEVEEYASSALIKLVKLNAKDFKKFLLE